MSAITKPQTSPLYTPRAKSLALVLLAMTQFVVVIDASIVNVALPSIGRALDFSQDNLSWVVNAYTLTFGGFLLLGGRMADLLGRRRMFILGLVLFATASLAGGLAQSDVWLIAARAVQGLGAALLSPAALSLVTVLFKEGAERNKAMGVWGAVAGSGRGSCGAVTWPLDFAPRTGRKRGARSTSEVARATKDPATTMHTATRAAETTIAKTMRAAEMRISGACIHDKCRRQIKMLQEKSLRLIHI